MPVNKNYESYAQDNDDEVPFTCQLPRGVATLYYNHTFNLVCRQMSLSESDSKLCSKEFRA